MPIIRPYVLLLAGAVSLLAFDAGRAFEVSTEAPAQLNPAEAFRSGARAYFAGDTDGALSGLVAAADQGHAAAQWKLAQMYAQGDGVETDHVKAFRYYSELADAHADDHPSTPQARFVANAFVALGSYYRDGIPETNVTANVRRAVDLYTYAATYFGDAEAQYHLARLYLDGKGVRHDPVQAARWLQLAARKSHAGAQALLGEMLFRGDRVPRKPVQGLMWLELARKGAVVPKQEWIFFLHEHAFAEAGSAERERALEMAARHTSVASQ